MKKTKIQTDILKAVERVILSGWFILGQEVKALEDEIAQRHKIKHAIGVNSGTDALWLALEALGIGEGDEVITTPFTFISPAEVIARTGATPVFADIDPETFLIDPEEILKKITDRTKAIIPVHLFGECCDMDEIMNIAEDYGLFVIEDAAQAFGTPGIGKGDCLCFSFHPSKCLGACGDGGMVLTNYDYVAEKIRSLRNHGADLSRGPEGKYHNQILGHNSRLDEIQAAILREKLKTFDKEPRKKLHTFRTPNRELVQEYLEKNGIDNKIYYSKLLHLLPVFKYLGYKKGDFPVAEKAAQEVLTVNVYV
jgi:dTDP-4-amino-4,6-dideoxygalactose transaminase